MASDERVKREIVELAENLSVEVELGEDARTNRIRTALTHPEWSFEEAATYIMGVFH